MDTGNCTAVAVTDTSRLTRNLLDFAQLATVAAQRSVLLLTPERAVDFRDADSAFFGSFLGLIAIRDSRARSHQNQRAPVGHRLIRYGWYEIAAQVRQTPEMRSALLVALTGYGQDRDRAHARQAGFDQHLTKPVDHATLLRVLRSPKPRG